MQVAQVWCKGFTIFQNFSCNLEKFKVTLITESEPGSGKDILTKAIRFLTDPHYISNSVALALAPVGPDAIENGFVKIKFKFNEEESSQNYITVTRTFAHIDFVSIEDNKPSVTITTIGKFQKMYKTHGTYIYPYVEFEVDSAFHLPNLFSFFEYKNFSYGNKAFTKIMGWINESGYKISEQIDCNHFKTMLENFYQLTVFERMHHAKKFMKLSSIANVIFRKVTNDRYSFQNVIRTNTGLKSLVLQDFEDGQQQDIVTIVKSGNEEILWSSIPATLKCLLRICVEIAVAYHFEIPILFLQNTDELMYYQEMQSVTSKLANDQGEPSFNEQDKLTVNYLQNLIDTCNEINLQVIIESNRLMEIVNCNILICNELACTQLESVPKSSVDNILKDLQDFI